MSRAEPEGSLLVFVLLLVRSYGRWSVASPSARRTAAPGTAPAPPLSPYRQLPHLKLVLDLSLVARAYRDG